MLKIIANNMLVKNLRWQDPLKLAQKIADNYHNKNWAFLYSALSAEVKGSISYLALFPTEELITNDFTAIKNDDEKWFGYLSYELGGDFEKIPNTKNSHINLPKIHLIKFGLIFEFNHDKKTLKTFYQNQKQLDEALNYKAEEALAKTSEVKNIISNFSDDSYLSAIVDIKKMIADGDFYQTNLTRKFFGELTKKNNQKENFALFSKLTKSSPANYSAFLKLDETFVISSSPELFLKVKNGKISSRPIKGTAARGLNAKQDVKNKLNLKNSPKERAENLMIIDLVRNDLARICKAGSVEVKKLFDITTYKTIHHMSSEVHGKINSNYNSFEAIKSCFPPGSMTGAPKIKAMEIAAKKERINRGIYSGAIGYLSAQEANMSVVIRTLIIQNNQFEFQVGGAITFDSDPKSELEEIFNKAMGIMNLLELKRGGVKPLK
jgi:para-aminobenzoate synthetase component 1